MWLAGHGRFLSLFFQEYGLSDTDIGILLSISPLVSTFSAPVLGFAADKAAAMDLRIPGTCLVGHAAALAVFVCGTTLCFLCFIFLRKGQANFGEFATVQCMYALSISAVFGCLDGLSIRFLTMTGGDRTQYGAERLYGAYGWALSSLVLGAASDVWGLVLCTYVCVVVNAVFVIFTLIQFSKGLIELAAIDRDAATRKTYNIVDQDQAKEKDGVGATTGDAIEEAEDNDHQKEDRRKGNDSKIYNVLHQDQEKNGESKSMAEVEETKNDDHQKHDNRKFNVSAASIMLLFCRLFGTPSRFGFVFCCVTMAAATSIVEKLVFLFFAQDLGASYLLCGLSVVVTVLFEVPIFAYASPLLKRFGAPRLLVIAAFAYVTRVVGYTFVPNKWLVLALEPLHGVTFACLTSARVEYVAAVTPDGLEATGQIIMGTMTSLGGSLVGSAVGGFVEETYGSRILYRGAAVVVAVAFFIYGVLAGIENVTSSVGVAVSTRGMKVCVEGEVCDDKEDEEIGGYANHEMEIQK